MNRFKNFIEWQAFGVLSAIGDKMGIATSRIRLWFMYTSLLTFGSPIIIYMVLAFWMNMKRYIQARRRNPLRYLWDCGILRFGILRFGKRTLFSFFMYFFCQNFEIDATHQVLLSFHQTNYLWRCGNTSFVLTKMKCFILLLNKKF